MQIMYAQHHILCSGLYYANSHNNYALLVHILQLNKVINLYCLGSSYISGFTLFVCVCVLQVILGLQSKEAANEALPVPSSGGRNKGVKRCVSVCVLKVDLVISPTHPSIQR